MAKYSKSYIKSDTQYPTFKGAIDPTNIELTQKGFNVTYETDFYIILFTKLCMHIMTLLQKPMLLYI